MTLTRKLLRELELNDEAIEHILAAHTEAVDALCSERDEARQAAAALEQAAAERDALRETAANHQQEAERLRSEFDLYRRQVDEERTAQGRKSAIREALRKAGANELALPLLAQAVSTTEADWDGAELRMGADVISPVVRQYGAFFAQPIPLPTDRCSPPLDGSALTREDVRGMSAEEINRNWSQVRSALNQHE